MGRGRCSGWGKVKPSPIRAYQHGASRLVSTLRLRLRLSAGQLLPLRTRPAAHDEPLSAAGGSYARGEATGRLADMLTSRRPRGGGVLTSGGQRPGRAETLTLLEYPRCGTGVCGQPVEIFFSKGFC